MRTYFYNCQVNKKNVPIILTLRTSSSGKYVPKRKGEIANWRRHACFEAYWRKFGTMVACWWVLRRSTRGLTVLRIEMCTYLHARRRRRLADDLRRRNASWECARANARRCDAWARSRRVSVYFVWVYIIYIYYVMCSLYMWWCRWRACRRFSARFSSQAHICLRMRRRITIHTNTMRQRHPIILQTPSQPSRFFYLFHQRRPGLEKFSEMCSWVYCGSPGREFAFVRIVVFRVYVMRWHHVRMCE